MSKSRTPEKSEKQRKVNRWIVIRKEAEIVGLPVGPEYFNQKIPFERREEMHNELQKQLLAKKEELGVLKTPVERIVKQGETYRAQGEDRDNNRNPAEKELASRELARRSLLHYIERTHTDYEAGWVHEDICRRLEKFVRDVEERKSPRLMLFLPPRSGKSLIASTYFPAWVLGKHPEWEFIMASYSADLPIGFSRRVRNQLQSPEYSAVFPTTAMSKDSTSAESWKTTMNGGLRAAGVLGGITGMGANCFLIDDPVKDMADADSATTREATWEWYSSTAYTRLAPGGGLAILQTRWSFDDLSGRLINKMNEAKKQYETGLKEWEALVRLAKTEAQYAEAQAVKKALDEELAAIDQWEIVEYQALATADEYLEKSTGHIIKNEGDDDLPSSEYQLLRRSGEALHEARFPRPLLLRYKQTMQPRHWAALYQQNPVPDEGLFFTKDLFRTRPHLPEVEELNCFAAWDLAIGMKNSNDYTVGIVGGIDQEDNLWILNMYRGRWGDLFKIANLIVDTHQRYKCILTGIEKGQLELALKPVLARVMKERKAYITLAEGDNALKPVTDKVVRARPLQGRMQQGTVLFPQDMPWVEVLRDEMLKFPAGSHDDAVDAMSWLVRLTTGQGVPMKHTSMSKLNGAYKSWRDRLNKLTSSGYEKPFMAR